MNFTRPKRRPGGGPGKSVWKVLDVFGSLWDKGFKFVNIHLHQHSLSHLLKLPSLGLTFRKTSYKRTEKGLRIQIMQQKDIHDMWCINDGITCITLQLMK